VLSLSQAKPFSMGISKLGGDQLCRNCEEAMLLMAYMDMNKAHTTYVRFLDSGCNNHMCGKKEYFSYFDESFRESVKLGNNTSMVVSGCK